MAFQTLSAKEAAAIITGVDESELNNAILAQSGAL